MKNLLIVYEIAEKASKVTTKKALREFERWVKNIVQIYHDTSVEHVAMVHLFRLKSEFSTA